MRAEVAEAERLAADERSFEQQGSTASHVGNLSISIGELDKLPHGGHYSGSSLLCP
jgi:hypothetical protein